jgi:8-oxo-dGTP diphosphatase
MSTRDVPTVQAAGAVLWRPSPDSPTGPVQVAIVHRPKYDDWSLPKGKTDPGEHLLACAVREVLEETGHAIKVGAPAGIQRYPVAGVPKQVHYWIARADDTAPAWPGTSEIDVMEFVPIPQATERLTQERDAALVAQSVAGLGDPPVVTSPLVILRHAKALSRKRWRRTDLERPLDSRGRAQADRLAILLACYGVERVVSSNSLRCVGTVQPYATAARLHVEIEARVSEEAHGDGNGTGASDAIAELLADPRPTVLCSHRPVLPALFEALGELPPSPFGMQAPEDNPLSPGEFVVVHRRWATSVDGLTVGGPGLVAAERHGP